jgi:hypothetical protein
MQSTISVVCTDATLRHENRYPKRKRAEVNYFDADLSADESTDSETECVPLKKVRSEPQLLAVYC